MTKDSKKKPGFAKKQGTLETFAGVFTPSILTILGIIFFLRLGFVVGSAGLNRALMILLLANGIGALRTHGSSAHGSGRVRYHLQPRHARLAVHAAHTIASFIIESWDNKKSVAV